MAGLARNTQSRLVKNKDFRIFQFPSVDGGKSSLPPLDKNPSLSPLSARREGNPEEAERETFQKGFEAGQESILSIAEEQISPVVKRLAQSLEAVARLQHEIVSQGEKDLVKLAVEIARKLVHREIQIDDKIIVALVRVSLEKLTDRGPITVFVHGDDCDMLEQHLQDLGPRDNNSSLVVKVSEKLSRGDCVIESEYGSVDARICQQFQEIERGLLGEF